VPAVVAIVDDLKGAAWINLAKGDIMFFDRQNRRHIRATRVADVIFVLLVLAALGYAVSTQSENTQVITDLIGVSSARAVQQQRPIEGKEIAPSTLPSDLNEKILWHRYLRSNW
jgi:hypothetical protein